jgi:hypothetical protein
MEMSVSGKLRDSFDELESDGEIGDWCFTDNDMSIWLRYPDGSERGEMLHLYITKEHSDSVRIWKWNGDRVAPTLAPSINVIGHWHGWLDSGKLMSA